MEYKNKQFSDQTNAEPNTLLPCNDESKMIGVKGDLDPDPELESFNSYIIASNQDKKPSFLKILL